MTDQTVTYEGLAAAEMLQKIFKEVLDQTKPVIVLSEWHFPAGFKKMSIEKAYDLIKPEPNFDYRECYMGVDFPLLEDYEGLEDTRQELVEEGLIPADVKPVLYLLYGDETDIEILQ